MTSPRRTRLLLVSIAALAVAACATAAEDPATATPDTSGSPTLPAPSQTKPGCTRSADCPAAPPCEEAACIDGSCVLRPVQCKGGSECAPSACDPATSACVSAPAPDRTECDKGFGQCVAGACVKLESCFGDSPMQYIHCDGTTYRDLSTGLYPKSRIDTYACADGEISRETALEFDPPPGANVTVTLEVTDAADVDLDLIVLEADCSGVAACAAQGVTAGTGTENAAFTAKAGRKYYVVVDGKIADATKFRVNVVCN